MRVVALCSLAVFLLYQVQCNEDTDSASQIHDVGLANYEISPIIGWERYSGDSARSISGWIRWWKYLRIKNPIIIKWVRDLGLRIYPNNEVFRSIFVRGIYDPNTVVVISALLPKGGVLIDVGAGMGYMSLLASRAVDNKCHIFALEPSKRDFARLVDNININNLCDVISTYRLAVSNKNGMAKLQIACEERSELNTLCNEFSSKGVEKERTEEVETKTIDCFVADNKIGRIDVMKLNIEGSEFNALCGAMTTIKKYSPAIVLGINPNAFGKDYKKLQNILTKIGYFAYVIEEKSSFALTKVENFSRIRTNVVFCFPYSTIPPILPQPKSSSIGEKIHYFFSR